MRTTVRLIPRTERGFLCTMTDGMWGFIRKDSGDLPDSQLEEFALSTFTVASGIQLGHHRLHLITLSTKTHKSNRNPRNRVINYELRVPSMILLTQIDPPKIEGIPTLQEIWYEEVPLWADFNPQDLLLAMELDLLQPPPEAL